MASNKQVFNSHLVKKSKRQINDYRSRVHNNDNEPENTADNLYSGNDASDYIPSESSTITDYQNNRQRKSNTHFSKYIEGIIIGIISGLIVGVILFFLNQCTNDNTKRDSDIQSNIISIAEQKVRIEHIEKKIDELAKIGFDVNSLYSDFSTINLKTQEIDNDFYKLLDRVNRLESRIDSMYEQMIITSHMISK